MVDADGRGLIADTEKAQSFVVGILSFDFNGVFKPSAKYPSLAEAIEVELVKCIGDDIAPMSDADRSKFANCLKEIGQGNQMNILPDEYWLVTLLVGGGLAWIDCFCNGPH